MLQEALKNINTDNGIEIKDVYSSINTPIQNDTSFTTPQWLQETKSTYSDMGEGTLMNTPESNPFKQAITDVVDPDKKRDLMYNADVAYSYIMDTAHEYKTTYSSLIDKYGSYENIPLNERSTLKKLKVKLKTLPQNLFDLNTDSGQYAYKMFSTVYNTAFTGSDVNINKNYVLPYIDPETGQLREIQHKNQKVMTDPAVLEATYLQGGVQGPGELANHDNLYLAQMNAYNKTDADKTDSILKKYMYNSRDAMQGFAANVANHFNNTYELWAAIGNLALRNLSSYTDAFFGRSDAEGFEKAMLEHFEKFSNPEKKKQLKEMYDNFYMGKSAKALSRYTDVHNAYSGMLAQGVNQNTLNNYTDAIFAQADIKSLLGNVVNSSGETLQLFLPGGIVSSAFQRTNADIYTAIQNDPSLIKDPVKLAAKTQLSMFLNTSVLAMDRMFGEAAIIEKAGKDLVSSGSHLLNVIDGKAPLIAKGLSPALLVGKKVGGEVFNLTKAFAGEAIQEPLDQLQQDYITKGQVGPLSQYLNASAIGGTSGSFTHAALNPVSLSGALLHSPAIMAGTASGAGSIVGLAATKYYVDKYKYKKGLKQAEITAQDRVTNFTDMLGLNNYSKEVIRDNIFKPFTSMDTNTFNSYVNAINEINSMNIEDSIKTKLKKEAASLYAIGLNAKYKNKNQAVKEMTDNISSNMDENTYTTYKSVLEQMKAFIYKTSSKEQGSVLNENEFKTLQDSLKSLFDEDIVKAIFENKTYKDFKKNYLDVAEDIYTKGLSNTKKALADYKTYNDKLSLDPNTDEIIEPVTEQSLRENNENLIRFTVSRAKNKLEQFARAIHKNKISLDVVNAILTENSDFRKVIKERIDALERENSGLNIIDKVKQEELEKLKHLYRLLPVLYTKEGKHYIGVTLINNEGKEVVYNQEITANRNNPIAIAQAYFNLFKHMNQNGDNLPKALEIAGDLDFLNTLNNANDIRDLYTPPKYNNSSKSGSKGKSNASNKKDSSKKAKIHLTKGVNSFGLNLNHIFTNLINGVIDGKNIQSYNVKNFAKADNGDYFFTITKNQNGKLYEIKGTINDKYNNITITSIKDISNGRSIITNKDNLDKLQSDKQIENRGDDSTDTDVNIKNNPDIVEFITNMYLTGSFKLTQNKEDILSTIKRLIDNKSKLFSILVNSEDVSQQEGQTTGTRTDSIIMKVGKSNLIQVNVEYNPDTKEVTIKNVMPSNFEPDGSKGVSDQFSLNFINAEDLDETEREEVSKLFQDFYNNVLTNMYEFNDKTIISSPTDDMYGNLSDEDISNLQELLKRISTNTNTSNNSNNNSNNSNNSSSSTFTPKDNTGTPPKKPKKSKTPEWLKEKVNSGGDIDNSIGQLIADLLSAIEDKREFIHEQLGNFIYDYDAVDMMFDKIEHMLNKSEGPLTEKQIVDSKILWVTDSVNNEDILKYLASKDKNEQLRFFQTLRARFNRAYKDIYVKPESPESTVQSENMSDFKDSVLDEVDITDIEGDYISDLDKSVKLADTDIINDINNLAEITESEDIVIRNTSIKKFVSNVEKVLKDVNIISNKIKLKEQQLEMNRGYRKNKNKESIKIKSTIDKLSNSYKKVQNSIDKIITNISNNYERDTHGLNNLKENILNNGRELLDAGIPDKTLATLVKQIDKTKKSIIGKSNPNTIIKNLEETEKYFDIIRKEIENICK